MRFEIEFFRGAGPIKLGMTIKQVREILGPDFDPVRRFKDTDFPEDYYSSIFVSVGYKRPGVVESLEFAEPAELIWEGHSLLKVPAEELKALLLSKDPELEVDGDGFTAHNLGIGGYAPNFDEDPRAPVEAVIVFEKGYYGETPPTTLESAQ